jgi:hypothetical protein
MSQELASFTASELTSWPVTLQLRFTAAGMGSDYGTAPANACELFLFYDEIVYLLASAPPNSAVDGLSSVMVFHQDGRGHGEVPQNTTGTVRETLVRP